MNLSVLQFLLILLCTIQVSISKEDAPRVTTPLGQIKGQYKVSYGNKTYKAFTGIPYAKPPIGDRRYQPPEPVGAWAGKLDATKDSVTCIQYNFENNTVIGAEDCLYLNIYVPQTQNSQPLPVIFYIHGGYFTTGSSMWQGPMHFMNKDLIFVSINYRLGPFGFLSTGDGIIPGNYGLKDQSTALRWISENIGYFGGDPKRITLTGCSAGAISVHYHYFSPLSAGLFQNGISMSGNALASWAVVNPKPVTMKFAKMLNCSTASSEEIARCLKRLPAHDICEAVYKLLWSEYLPVGISTALFRPVVENIKEGYFINRSPREILKNKGMQDVPWIAGVVSEEGITESAGFIFNQTSLSYIDKNWDSVGPYLLVVQEDLPKEKRIEIARLARQQYFGNDSFTVSDLNLFKFVYMTGDKIYLYETQKAAKLQAKANKSPVRVYYYSYRAGTSYGDVLLKTTKNYGVCHADDMAMVLETDFINPALRPEDAKVSQFLINMWYTFAERGEVDVGTVWPKVDGNGEYLQYLHISDSDNVTFNTTDNFAERKFWKSIGI